MNVGKVQPVLGQRDNAWIAQDSFHMGCAQHEDNRIEQDDMERSPNAGREEAQNLQIFINLGTEGLSTYFLKFPG